MIFNVGFWRWLAVERYQRVLPPEWRDWVFHRTTFWKLGHPAASTIPGSIFCVLSRGNKALAITCPVRIPRKNPLPVHFLLEVKGKKGIPSPKLVQNRKAESTSIWRFGTLGHSYIMLYVISNSLSLSNSRKVFWFFWWGVHFPKETSHAMTHCRGQGKQQWSRPGRILWPSGAILGGFMSKGAWTNALPINIYIFEVITIRKKKQNMF